MKKAFVIMLCLVVIITMFSGCGTKKAYGDNDGAPHIMTIVDETMGYKIYRHDETGVWYFCRDGGYGCSVCVMVNPDGTPYTGG